MASTTTFRVHRARQAAVITICTLLLTGRAAAADADKSTPSQPGEISVGDPISLPVPQSSDRKPATDAATAVDAAPAANQQSGVPGVPVTPQTVVPGNGWLGLAAEESKQPGRWVVADVAANGPAATAGIRVGDELRAINGTTLSNAEELAQSMTSFAAGQDVRLAIGRGTEVVDVVVRASSRPPAATKPNWQAATAGPSAAPPAGAGNAPATPRAPTGDTVPPSSLAGPAASPPSTPETFRSAVVDAPAPLPGPTGSRWRTPDFAAAPASAATEPSRLAVDPPAGRLPARENLGALESPPTAAPQSTDRREDTDQRVGSGRPALGVRTLPIDSGMQARFRLTQPTGAYVLGVVQDLPASRAGVPPGSVIVALGDQPVRNPADLTKLVAGGPVGRPVSLEYVLPGGEERRADVVLQPLELPMQRALVGPEPTAVPTLQRAERAVAPAAALEPAADADAVRQEVRFLRQRLERLEQWLDRRPAVGSVLR